MVFTPDRTAPRATFVRYARLLSNKDVLLEIGHACHSWEIAVLSHPPPHFHSQVYADGHPSASRSLNETKV